MDTPIAALMLVISYSTTGTPPEVLDDTHVLTSGYESMAACVADLQSNPLSEAEVAVELRYKFRTLRMCVPVNSDTYFSWTEKQVIGQPSTMVETGPVTTR